jgi:hypothetical protein
MRLRDEMYKPAVLLLLAGAPCLLNDGADRMLAFALISVSTYAIARLWIRQSRAAEKNAAGGSITEGGLVHDNVMQPVIRHLQATARISPVLAEQLQEVIRQTERAALDLGEKFTAIAGRARNRTAHTDEAVALTASAEKILSRLNAIEAGPVGAGRAQAGEQVEAERADETAADVLMQLAAEMSGVRRRLESTRAETAALAKDAAGIVVSLQFQDITRQRIEHVIEPLERLQQESKALLRTLEDAAGGEEGRDYRDDDNRLERMYTMESERDVMKRKFPAVHRR